MALKYLLVLIVMLGVTVSKSVFARPEASSYLVLPETTDTLKEYADNFYDDPANVEYQMQQALNRYPVQRPIAYPVKWIFAAPQNQLLDRGVQKIYREKVEFKPQDLVKAELENVATDKRTSSGSSCKFKNKN